MNNRIKELVRESHLDVYGLGKERYKWEYTVEKFAELIVRECVKVMYDNAIERKVGLEIDKRPTYYAAAILEHFGAKE
jgi:hypothetical protein